MEPYVNVRGCLIRNPRRLTRNTRLPTRRTALDWLLQKRQTEMSDVGWSGQWVLNSGSIPTVSPKLWLVIKMEGWHSCAVSLLVSVTRNVFIQNLAMKYMSWLHFIRMFIVNVVSAALYNWYAQKPSLLIYKVSASHSSHLQHICKVGNAFPVGHVALAMNATV